MYIDNLVGSPYGLFLSHILPLTETSTIGETNDVIAVNGSLRTEGLPLTGITRELPYRCLVG
ncbi:MAG: hypothetical protein P5700_27215, partial [Arthrospira platensis PCC 7345]|nr:hypothetical protein [Arthrospira platensis PCC 7345]